MRTINQCDFAKTLVSVTPSDVWIMECTPESSKEEMLTELKAMYPFKDMVNYAADNIGIEDIDFAKEWAENKLLDSVKTLEKLNRSFYETATVDNSGRVTFDKERE